MNRTKQSSEVKTIVMKPAQCLRPGDVFQIGSHKYVAIRTYSTSHANRPIVRVIYQNPKSYSCMDLPLDTLIKIIK